MIRMPITPCLPSRPEPTSVDTAELSKVDPSVSVCCDVHNTLVNSTLRLFGNDYVKDKYLPGLATNVVSRQAE
jgi:alkylation response protein AidB-like acyl-CoA dehydrogenase